MNSPIRIHHADSEQEMKDRYERVVRRLDELGHQQVTAMFARDDFPQPWAPIIRAWLKSKD